MSPPAARMDVEGKVQDNKRYTKKGKQNLKLQNLFKRTNIKGNETSTVCFTSSTGDYMSESTQCAEKSDV